MADGPDVASFTHDVDGPARPPEASTWLALPVGRDVLVAACLVVGGTTVAEVVELTAAEVREWAIGWLLYVGTSQAKAELCSARFRTGYSEYGPAATEFLAVVRSRVDAAFGFGLGSAPDSAGRQPHHPPTPGAAAPAMP